MPETAGRGLNLVGTQLRQGPVPEQHNRQAYSDPDEKQGTDDQRLPLEACVRKATGYQGSDRECQDRKDAPGYGYLEGELVLPAVVSKARRNEGDGRKRNGHKGTNGWGDHYIRCSSAPRTDEGE